MFGKRFEQSFALPLWAASALVLWGAGEVNAAGEKKGGTEPRVSITVKDDVRIVESSGLPNHETGKFPNRGNPNTIGPQNYVFRMPASPKAAEKISTPDRALIGVALNGVPFDPGTAEFWRGDQQSGWRYEANSGKLNLGLDMNLAHVQPNGAYHYHGLPQGLLEKLGDAKNEKMTLLGYAADGFPLYNSRGYSKPLDAKSELKTLASSYRLKQGKRPDGPGGSYDGTFVQDWEWVKDAGDLDECNGRTGVTPESAEPTYYYVLTKEFPFIPRMLRGTPDASFRHGPPGGGRPGGRPPGPPPFFPPFGGPPPGGPPMPPP